MCVGFRVPWAIGVVLLLSAEPVAWTRWMRVSVRTLRRLCGLARPALGREESTQ
jgi:hypothetical protein